MKRPAFESLKAHAKRFTFIPLHKPDDVSSAHGRTRKIGKTPLEPKWTTAKYNSADVLKRCGQEGRNMGVRLTPELLVIDCDPRNGSDEFLPALKFDFDLDEALARAPRVITGSGGSHFYFTKPADVPVVDTLKDYKGIEFKSHGRQVVAPGSIHPDTQARYVRDKKHPDFDSIPPCPESLLRMIRRPERAAIKGGGQYSQEQIAKALSKLDATAFRAHDEWFALMASCHHASNGDARSEFVEWSVSDPQYANDAEVIGRRWDSLHSEKHDGFTYRTLNKILADAGQANAQATPEVPDDEFDDDVSFSDGDDDEDADQKSALEKLNEKYCVVIEGSHAKVMCREDDPVMQRQYWSRMSAADFCMYYGNRKIERFKKPGSKAHNTVKLGVAWLEWPSRRTYQGVVFDPEHQHTEHLNLYEGFAYEPSKEGDWSRLRELMFEVIADGDDEVFTYLERWLAYLFQHPGSHAETAIILRGGMGVGKGTLGNFVAKVIGRHALAIGDAGLITGRFNAHLQDLLFLFADEAVKPYDKAAEARFKNLITEPTLAIEGKGRDVVSARNLIHIIAATNDKWAVPAAFEERRFLITDVNSKWQGQRAKWQALHDQLSQPSAKQRFLFDMTTLQLPPDWHPRLLPQTKALADNKQRSFAPLVQFVQNALGDGRFTALATRGGPWATSPIRVFAEEFRDAFALWCRSNNIHPGASGRANHMLFAEELRETLPVIRDDVRDRVSDMDAVPADPIDGRAPAIEFPALPVCRAAFEARTRTEGRIAWPPLPQAEGDFDFG